MVILDVAIGIIFMFLLLALVVTVVQESAASFLKLRAKNLYDAVENLLDDEDLVAEVYQHSLIRSLYRYSKPNGNKPDKKAFIRANVSRLPSYIPSRSFAIALIDVLRSKTDLAQAVGVDTLLSESDKVVNALPEGSPLRKSLKILVADAEAVSSEISERARAASQQVEQWFNESMCRAAGWYKRKAQVLSFVIAAVVTLVANADALYVGKQLWQNSNLRASVAGIAATYYNENQNGSESLELGKIFSDIKQSALPIGWHVPKKNLGICPRPYDKNGACSFGLDGVIPLLLGWIITALAVSLGAAFWFDTLSKALQLRGSGSRIAIEPGQADKKVK